MVLSRLLTTVTLILGLGTALGLGNDATVLAQPAIPQSAASTPILPQRLQALKLTPDQMQKVSALQAKYKDQLLKQRQQLLQAQQQLENAMLKNAPESELRTQYRQVQTQKQQYEDLRFEVTLQFHNILTPQQRQQLVTLNRQRLANYARRAKTTQPAAPIVPGQTPSPQK